MIKIDIEKRHMVQILTPVRRIYKFVIGRDIYALFDLLCRSLYKFVIGRISRSTESHNKRITIFIV
jgi:hypothetical protein